MLSTAVDNSQHGVWAPGRGGSPITLLAAVRRADFIHGDPLDLRCVPCITPWHEARIGAVYAHRSVSSFIQTSRIDAYDLERAATRNVVTEVDEIGMTGRSIVRKLALVIAVTAFAGVAGTAAQAGDDAPGIFRIPGTDYRVAFDASARPPEELLAQPLLGAIAA
jgi:hypothetical protein